MHLEKNKLAKLDNMLKESPFIKLHIIVPASHADLIRNVLGKEGAGMQGNYTHCSGSYRQMGRFKPMQGAHPAIGEVGKLAEVEEEAIETICHKDIVEKVIEAIKKVHPYEEPAIDIMPRYEIVN